MSAFLQDGVAAAVGPEHVVEHGEDPLARARVLFELVD